MTSGVGKQIEVLEYNAIQSQIAAVLSTQYGQTNLSSSQVPAALSITAAQWKGLRNDMYRIADHQGRTRPTLTDPLPTVSFTGSLSGSVLTVASGISGGTLQIGQTIGGAGIPFDTIITSFGTGTGGAGTYNVNTTTGNVSSSSLTATYPVKITEADRAAYLSAASTLNNSSYYYVLPADLTTPATVSSLSYTNLNPGKTITHTVTMTFPSGTGYTRDQAATYFFNSGSVVSMGVNFHDYQTTGGADSPATLDVDYYNLLSSAGTTTFGRSTTTNSGDPSHVVNANFGFINASNTETTIYTRTIADTVLYGGTNPDKFWITVQYASGVLTFRLYMSNTYTSTGYATPGSTQPSPAKYYAVTGTFTSTVSTVYPSSPAVSVSAYYPASGISASFVSN
jgi:hypothetical protein